MERRWKRKQRSRASPDACSNLRPISDIKSTPGWLIGPNVSKATGWKMMFVGKVAYFNIFRSAASSATLYAWDNGAAEIQESARVFTTATSQARDLLRCHGISVRPSGRLPEVRDIPDGFFVEGTPAFTSASQIESLKEFNVLAYDPLPVCMKAHEYL